jgi:hypothetical protein
MEDEPQPLHRKDAYDLLYEIIRKSSTKSIHQDNPKPPLNTYNPDDERRSCQQGLVP